MHRLSLFVILSFGVIFSHGCGDSDEASAGLQVTPKSGGSGSGSSELLIQEPDGGNASETPPLSEAGQAVEATMQELVEVAERMVGKLRQVTDRESAERIAGEVRGDYARFGELMDEVQVSDSLPEAEKDQINERYGERFMQAFGEIIAERMRIQQNPDLDPPIKKMLDELDAE